MRANSFTSTWRCHGEGAVMGRGTEAATEQVQRELFRILDAMRAELDRIEMLTAALDAFNKPVPDYEPGFQHLRHLTRHVSEFK